MAKVSALFLLALLTISMLHTPAAGLVKLPSWAPKWLDSAPEWLKRALLKAKPPKLSPGTAYNIKCGEVCTKLCSTTQYPKRCLQPCFNCCKKCRNDDNPCKC